MRTAKLNLVFAAVLCACPALADWPNFRGPTHDNYAEPEGLDLSLVDAQERVLWRIDVGIGYTGVAVADGLAYTAGWNEGVTTLRCFSPETGEPVWTFDYDIPRYDQVDPWPKSNEGGPTTTPAIRDGRIYHTTRDGRLFCLDAKTGERVWGISLIDVFGIEEPRWGFSGSPLVIGDVIYLDIGKIVAVDRATGEPIWQTDDHTPSYSTPTAFTYQGRELLAAFPLDGLVIVDRKTGGLVAKHRWESNQPCHTATPVVFDGDKVFISSGFNTGGAVLRFTGDALELVWENTAMCNTMTTSLYRDGYLYGFDGKVLKCIDAVTGEAAWSQRGLGEGSLIAVGDSMVVFSEGGEIMSAPMTPEAFKPGPETRLIFETRVWSPPTLSDGRLFLRGSRGDLVCVDVRAH